MKNNLSNYNYNCIDLAKFIFAICIVGIHIHPYSQQNIYAHFFFNKFLFRLAVPIYFVISGFLCFKKLNLNNVNFSDISKQVFKIIKIYIIWSVIYLPISIYQIINNPNGIKKGIISYIHGLIISGSYGHLWYLYALIFSILLIYTLVKKGITLKNIFIISFIFYIFGLLGQSYFFIIKPISKYPYIWEILKFFCKIIGSTRNGLFFGFFFVFIGFIFSQKKKKLKYNNAVIFFIIFLILFFFEAILINKYKLFLNYDMYLMTIPTAFFLFYIILHTELTNNNIYVLLRNISALIFYNHLLIAFILIKFLGIKEQSFLTFTIIYIISFLCSFIILKLSDNKKFMFLNILYK